MSTKFLSERITKPIYDIHWEKNEADGDVINKIFYAFEPLT